MDTVKMESCIRGYINMAFIHIRMHAHISYLSGKKASLSSNSGGMNLGSASLTCNGPAAYLGSISPSQPLVEVLLGWPLGGSLNTSSTVTSLSITIACPDWQSRDDINVPLHQRSLSFSIDDASHHQLHMPALSTHLHALALSSGLPHSGGLLNGTPSSALT